MRNWKNFCKKLGYQILSQTGTQVLLWSFCFYFSFPVLLRRHQTALTCVITQSVLQFVFQSVCLQIVQCLVVRLHNVIHPLVSLNVLQLVISPFLTHVPCVRLFVFLFVVLQQARVVSFFAKRLHVVGIVANQQRKNVQLLV